MKINEMSLYEEGLSILQIKPDDLRQFLPETQNENINTLNITPLKELDRALAEDSFDATAVHRIMSELVERASKRM
jgi:hypothetical protein